MRNSFDRAGRFLALSALLAVLLAGVATALAANRFALLRIDTVAVLRCLGARQRDILAALSLQLLLLAIPACALGIGIGMLAQMVLVEALGSLIPARLPLPQAAPVLSGAGIGLLLLLGFGLPPLLRLRGVPPMRVLNRSFAALPPASLLTSAYRTGRDRGAGGVRHRRPATRDLGPRWPYRAGGAGRPYRRGAAVAAAPAAAARAWRLETRPYRALTRRRALAVVQLVGLSLSLCALLLLAVIGPGLLSEWRDRLPPDTPNHFLLNVQRDQGRRGRADVARRRRGPARPATVRHRPAGGDQRPAATAQRRRCRRRQRRRLQPSRQLLLAHDVPAGQHAAVGRILDTGQHRRRSLGRRRLGQALRTGTRRYRHPAAGRTGAHVHRDQPAQGRLGFVPGQLLRTAQRRRGRRCTVQPDLQLPPALGTHRGAGAGHARIPQRVGAGGRRDPAAGARGDRARCPGGAAGDGLQP